MNHHSDNSFCAILLIVLLLAFAAYMPLARAQGVNAAGRVAPKPLRFASITAGQDHTCGLTVAGQAYCWGSNSNGQLGIGRVDGERHDEPLRVSEGLHFREISAGFLHTCALDTKGSAFCWGSNQCGQLGTGSLLAASVPTPVTGSLNFHAISSGGTHTCGLAAAGIAHCWGGNWHGQIGDGTFDGDSDTSCCHKVPVMIKAPVRFATISVGGISTCAVSTNGHAYCWGNGSDGRLGIHQGDLKDRNQPTLVATDVTVMTISARGHHACLTDKKARAFCWGQGSEGQLAAGEQIERTDAPILAATGHLFTSLEVGMYHTCGIETSGHLYCWGNNRFGEATGEADRVLDPKLLFPKISFESVTIGGNDFSGHTCALSSAGAVFCWGDNRKGQLGEFAATRALKHVNGPRRSSAILTSFCDNRHCESPAGHRQSVRH